MLHGQRPWPPTKRPQGKFSGLHCCWKGGEGEDGVAFTGFWMVLLMSSPKHCAHTPRKSLLSVLTLLISCKQLDQVDLHLSLNMQIRPSPLPRLCSWWPWSSSSCPPLVSDKRGTTSRSQLGFVSCLKLSPRGQFMFLSEPLYFPHKSCTPANAQWALEGNSSGGGKSQ